MTANKYASMTTTSKMNLEPGDYDAILRDVDLETQVSQEGKAREVFIFQFGIINQHGDEVPRKQWATRSLWSGKTGSPAKLYLLLKGYGEPVDDPTYVFNPGDWINKPMSVAITEHVTDSGTFDRVGDWKPARPEFTKQLDAVGEQAPLSL